MELIEHIISTETRTIASCPCSTIIVWNCRQIQISHLQSTLQSLDIITIILNKLQQTVFMKHLLMFSMTEKSHNNTRAVHLLLIFWLELVLIGKSVKSQ